MVNALVMGFPVNGLKRNVCAGKNIINGDTPAFSSTAPAKAILLLDHNEAVKFAATSIRVHPLHNSTYKHRDSHDTT
ncbi:hypothetical protein [Aliamphritea spongicola]|nr:hypothetical protein [Aliamphritea spongicola]